MTRLVALALAEIMRTAEDDDDRICAARLLFNRDVVGPREKLEQLADMLLARLP